MFRQECDRLLERLQYAQVFSMQELLALLEAVRSRRRLHAGLRLLVVDSLAALAAPLLASPGFIGRWQRDLSSGREVRVCAAV